MHKYTPTSTLFSVTGYHVSTVPVSKFSVERIKHPENNLGVHFTTTLADARAFAEFYGYSEYYLYSVNLTNLKMWNVVDVENWASLEIVQQIVNPRSGQFNFIRNVLANSKYSEETTSQKELILMLLSMEINCLTYVNNVETSVKGTCLCVLDDTCMSVPTLLEHRHLES